MAESTSVYFIGDDETSAYEITVTYEDALSELNAAIHWRGLREGWENNG